MKLRFITGEYDLGKQHFAWKSMSPEYYLESLGNIKMNRSQVIFASITVVIFFPLAAHANFSTTTIRSSGGCVNFRAEPSIDAAIIACLEPGTDIQIYRLPPTGRFAWVEDQTKHLWYRALIPSTDIGGWIMPSCTSIFENPTAVCADLGS
jgi:hypothetical protein